MLPFAFGLVLAYEPAAPAPQNFNFAPAQINQGEATDFITSTLIDCGNIVVSEKHNVDGLVSYQKFESTRIDFVSSLMDVTYKSHEKFVYPPARYQYKDATPRHLAGSLSRLNPDIQISGNALTVHCTSGACLDAYEGERIATTQVTGASELTLRLCSEEEAKKVMSALRTLILKNGGKTARY